MEILYSDPGNNAVLEGESLGPFKTGLIYGMVAVLIVLAANFYFLFVDPLNTTDWVLALITQYLPLLALAAYFFLAIFAALKVKPTRVEPDVPWGSQLMRAGALAATIIAVLVGVIAFFSTALQATVFANQMKVYAQEAAPRITAYTEEVRQVQRKNPPPPFTVEEIERGLQPPTLNDLGRSITTMVLLALVMGTLGGIIGALRGRLGSGPPGAGKP